MLGRTTGVFEYLFTLLTQESMLEDEFSNKTFFPQLIKDGCLTL